MTITRSKLQYKVLICLLVAMIPVKHALSNDNDIIEMTIASATLTQSYVAGSDVQIEIKLSQKSTRDFSQFTEKNVRSHISVQIDGHEILRARLDTPIHGGSLIIDQVPGDKTLLDRLNSGESALTVETVPTRKR